MEVGKWKFLTEGQHIGLVTANFSGGQPRKGVEKGPQAVLDAGLLQQLQNDLGYIVEYDGDLLAREDELSSEKPEKEEQGLGKMKNGLLVSNATRKICDRVYQYILSGKFALTIGGDHSIAIGSVSGVSKAMREMYGKEISLVWVDAHADINTPESSETGNVHGMPVAFLTGIAKDKREQLFSWLTKECMINLKKLVYIGLRSVDPGERNIIREQNIKAFSMHDIDRYGIGKIMDMTLEWIGKDTPIHLSFDVDSLDPMWAPSTGTPVRGGLTFREGTFITEVLSKTGNLVALDLVEINPLLERQGAADTARAGCSIIRCALGETLL